MRWIPGALAGLVLAGAATGRADEAPPRPPTAEEQELLKSLEADRASRAPVAPAGETRPSQAAPAVPAMPDMTVILDVAGGWFSDDPLQPGAHDPARTGLTLQALELGIQGNVDPYFAFLATLVFTLDGVEIEEAWARTTSLPGNLQVRAGRLLTRFGRINTQHLHQWAFLDLQLVNGKMLGGDGSRALAAEVSWLAPLPWFLEIVLQVSQADEETAKSFYQVGGAGHDHGPDSEAGEDDADRPPVTLQEGLSLKNPKNLLYAAAIQQFWALSDAWSLSWGVSGMFGPNAAPRFRTDGTAGGGNRTYLAGTDVYLRFKPVGDPGRTSVSLQAEGMYRWRDAPEGDPATWADRKPGVRGLQDWGVYAQVTARFERRWEVGARYEYVSGLDWDWMDPDWTGPRQRATVQATFFPSHFSRIRLQGAWDRPSWRSGPIWSAVAGLEVSVGAHGAHSF